MKGNSSPWIPCLVRGLFRASSSAKVSRLQDSGLNVISYNRIPLLNLAVRVDQRRDDRSRLWKASSASCMGYHHLGSMLKSKQLDSWRDWNHFSAILSALAAHDSNEIQRANLFAPRRRPVVEQNLFVVIKASRREYPLAVWKKMIRVAITHFPFSN